MFKQIFFAEGRRVLMLYLLRTILVFGGLFMGIGASRALYIQGFDLALALNALLYLGCAIYGAPRLIRLLGRGRQGR